MTQEESPVRPESTAESVESEDVVTEPSPEPESEAPPTPEVTNKAAAAGGKLVAQALYDRGVRTLFTLAGGHISPILVEAEGLGMRVIDVRDEKNAAFAADAMGRLSETAGVAVVTAGPGVTNTLTALRNAEMAGSPMVVLGGAAATMLQGRGALQDIDQMAAVESHVKWEGKVTRVNALVPALEKAFKMARSGVPGPVFLELPIDLLYDEKLVREWYAASTPKEPKNAVQSALRWYLTRHVERVFNTEEKPPRVDLSKIPKLPGVKPLGPLADQAARLLKKCERPVLLVGSQAARSAGRINEVAAAVSDLRLPTYLAGMARGLLGANSDIQIRHKRRNALKEADLVILAGVPADFRLDYGRSIGAQAKIIAVNLDSAAVIKNRVPTLPVPGDPEEFLIRLSRTMGERKGSFEEWLDRLRTRDQEREREIDQMAASVESSTSGSPLINPIALCRAIDRNISEDGIIVADGGDFVATAAYTVRARGPLSWLDPGAFGTLGVGAGFAMAASVLNPDREVWLLYGDGAAGFSLVEFDTMARHKIPVIAVVGNDAGWTQIERDQVQILKSDVGCRLVHTRYDLVAEGYGAKGFHLTRIEEADQIFSAAKEAVKSGQPVLINAEIGKTDFRKGSISM